MDRPSFVQIFFFFFTIPTPLSSCSKSYLFIIFNSESIIYLISTRESQNIHLTSKFNIFKNRPKTAQYLITPGSF